MKEAGRGKGCEWAMEGLGKTGKKTGRLRQEGGEGGCEGSD